jgi:hypothetical protein
LNIADGRAGEKTSLISEFVVVSATRTGGRRLARPVECG